ncbi:hypothetical protein ACU4I5_05705 [Ensifer adhaerens]
MNQPKPQTILALDDTALHYDFTPLVALMFGEDEVVSIGSLTRVLEVIASAFSFTADKSSLLKGSIPIPDLSPLAGDNVH